MNLSKYTSDVRFARTAVNIGRSVTYQPCESSGGGGTEDEVEVEVEGARFLVPGSKFIVLGSRFQVQESR
jgi:hypothetical protein